MQNTLSPVEFHAQRAHVLSADVDHSSVTLFSNLKVRIIYMQLKCVGWSASLQPNEARQRRLLVSARYAQRVEKCGRTEKK